MIIVLTDAKTGLPFTVEASLILFTRTVIEVAPRKRMEKNSIITEEPDLVPEDKRHTHCVTGVTHQGQLQAFDVIETPLEIGQRINSALKSDVAPGLLGFPMTASN